MDSESTTSQSESQFLALLEKHPVPVAEALTLIHTATVTESGKKADEWTALLMQTLSDASEFTGLYQVVKNRQVQLSSALKATGIRDLLKKACKDRLADAMIDTAAFGSIPVEESFRRLDLLLSLSPGSQVIIPHGASASSNASTTFTNAPPLISRANPATRCPSPPSAKILSSPRKTIC